MPAIEIVILIFLILIIIFLILESYAYWKPFLININFFKAWEKKSPAEKKQMIINIIDAFQELSNTKTGAIITIEKDVKLHQYINLGIQIDSIVNSQLIVAIFNKKSPVHDGAIIIRKGRIISICSYLPSTTKKISSFFGSRHRAGLGISEISDALTLIVSETTGRISYTYNYNIQYVDNAIELYDIIAKHISLKSKN